MVPRFVNRGKVGPITFTLWDDLIDRLELIESLDDLLAWVLELPSA